MAKTIAFLLGNVLGPKWITGSWVKPNKSWLFTFLLNFTFKSTCELLLMCQALGWRWIIRVGTCVSTLLYSGNLAYAKSPHIFPHSLSLARSNVPVPQSASSLYTYSKGVFRHVGIAIDFPYMTAWRGLLDPDRLVQRGITYARLNWAESVVFLSRRALQEILRINIFLFSLHIGVLTSICKWMKTNTVSLSLYVPQLCEFTAWLWEVTLLAPVSWSPD